MKNLTIRARSRRVKSSSRKSERYFFFTFHFSIVQNPLSQDTGLQVINPDSTRNDSRQLEWGGLHIAPRSPRSTIYKEYFHPTGAKQRLKYEQLAIQLELNTEQSLWAQLWQKCTDSKLVFLCSYSLQMSRHNYNYKTIHQKMQSNLFCCQKRQGLATLQDCGGNILSRKLFS